MTEAIDRVLERITRAIIMDSDELIAYDNEIYATLERELKPLLEAGQAMRDSAVIECEELGMREDWDAALAPAQAGKERAR